ncbi:MAG: 4-hydroxythreonine-4-phosphate dehydrogenase PdxA [Candidatus Latescibacterota bacterium]|nr:MAG: 4-hydroxythreonine-4-phosphate dehydrogenase PdxA [Candidatus Latescibacterota bacterium]
MTKTHRSKHLAVDAVGRAVSPIAGHRPVIAVTVGDPGGVGPEIVTHLFGKGFRPRRSRALVVGSATALAPWIERYGMRVSVVPLARGRLALDARCRAVAAELGKRAKDRGSPRVFLVDTGCRERYSLCRDTKGGGRHAGLALELACGLAHRGVVEGFVTAPISKNALAKAGYPYTGHTEMFLDVFGAPECQMIMVYKDFRVVPLTRHLPLDRVCKNLSRAKILSGLTAVARALERDFGIDRPRIAVAGLNPHAGDGGLVGREEIEVIEPAIKRARKRGLRVTGPFPGDALFQDAAAGGYDAYVAMYHDQGLIPFKLVSKKRGVNVTTGLPVVRTSVDHGVAYDIAGQGIASTVSLKAAYRLAEDLIARRRTFAK